MSKLNDELIEIGYILKSHGYKGDLKIRIHDDIELLSKMPKAFFLFIKDEFIPFFTESLNYFTDSEALLHLEDIDSKEEAARYKSHALFLKRDEVKVAKKAEENQAYIGYSVEDLDNGMIGTVDDVLSFPQQELLSVRYGKKEVLIPLRPELIHELDNENRHIVFKLPDGFLEI